jgi:DNA gyrase subunit A
MTEGTEITKVLIEDEMKDSYLSYAMSVIISRALPDARDGLKPSQRRILVAMNDLGLSPEAKFRKCAKIAGDTSGNYHPHGEQVIYPTLVRMAQDFAMRYPLIEGQGNFGSIDGDPPAAMRYTEARMSNFAMMLLEDIDKDTVDFVPNYDETRSEPVVLPAKFPNLLCCGSSGIAVGMATSIPPHNISEVCGALIALIENPSITIEGLMQYIKGPDFPTGGMICGINNIEVAYKTGKALIQQRGRVQIEDKSGGRKNIVITELPFEVAKSKLIQEIANLVKEEKVTGLADIRDESDREGLRVVLEVKRGEDENIIINQLYTNSSLQSTFSIIMIALVDKKPKLLNLKELLEIYLRHRFTVITRRTRYELEKSQKELHILDGIIKATSEIDEVIQILKTSNSPADAKKALIIRFEFTELQVDAILKMPLSKLTGLEQEKLHKDGRELTDKIASYKEILADEKLVYGVIRTELNELMEKYSDKRRTEIVFEEPREFLKEELIPEEDMIVVLTHEGYIKRVGLASYRRQHRGGAGVIGVEMRESDFVKHVFIANTKDYILFFTDSGRVLWKRVYELPLMSRVSMGKILTNLLELKSEKITTVVPVRDFGSGFLVMATSKGTIKKTNLSEFDSPRRDGIIAIRLEEGDKLVGVERTDGNCEVMLGTKQGLAIRFPEKDVRAMGRTASGVVGLRLRKDDNVTDMVIVKPDATLLTVCEQGFGKRTSFDQYRTQHRGGYGLINIKTTERNGKVVGIKVVKDEDDLIMMTQKGQVLRIPVKDIRSIGRNTQGVRLFKLPQGDKIVSFAKVEKEEESQEVSDLESATK